MDKKKLNRRIENINERIEQLTDISRMKYTEYESHLTSRYYTDALSEDASLLIPAESIEEYNDRRHKHGRKQSDFNEFLETGIKQVSQRWYDKSDIRVGIIADEFFYKSFEGTCDLVYVSPLNYAELLPNIDLLIVSSTWRGIDGAWTGINNANDPLQELFFNELVPLAKTIGIDIAFYSKEDPPNYSLFLKFARAAKYIFTTSIETIPRYLADCPDAAHVECIPFAVNPIWHNPIDSQKNKGDYFVFAGSWFRHKYGERRVAATKILDSMSNSETSLVIMDRNSENDMPRYLFPERFIPDLMTAGTHEQSLNIQRNAKIAVNLNSVVNSQTMFANRVLELQAIGTPIISNYNAGVNSEFPHVFMPDSKEDTDAFLEIANDEYRLNLVIKGVRTVFSRFHTFDAFTRLLDTCGLSKKNTSRSLAVVCEDAEYAKDFLESQTYQTDVFTFSNFEEAIGSGCDLLVPIDSSRSYSVNYLLDFVNGYKYSDATVITADNRQLRSNENLFSFRDSVIDIYTSSFWICNASTAQAIHAAAESGIERYAFNDVLLISNEIAEEVSSVDDSNNSDLDYASDNSYILSVVVPIYNNGKHLEDKCFQSLLRSSIFHKMEILFVDDGSTDPETISITDSISSRYSNVALYRFPSGGSGSASRPRNKGLELANAEFVTYLDPDNEALNDGFAKQVEILQQNDVNFVIGNMIKFSDKRLTVNNSGHLRKFLKETSSDLLFECEEDTLAKINFQPMSIQALVTRVDWLRSLDLVQPVGAVGQDSYFFQQMIHYADRIAVVDLPIHSYYGAVANSTVNSLGPNFYKKYLPLEKDRSSWLSRVGLLEEYISRRFIPFLDKWYLAKLRSVPVEQHAECLEIISQILGFYQPDQWDTSKLAMRYSELYS